MSVRAFLDTNVVVYAYDESEPEKRALARALLGGTSDVLVVSLQVLQEAYVALTRLAVPLAPDDAERAVRLLAELELVRPDETLLFDGIRTSQRFGISFWDGLILASARQARVDKLLGEDLDQGQDYDGVVVVNPFAARPG
jgi:predicted nucleic acid-binding protein